MKSIYAEHDVPSGSCGMGVVYDFGYTGQQLEYNYKTDKYEKRGAVQEGEGELLRGTMGGTGYLSAGFVYGDELCDEAFAQLAKKYKVVFITEARKNVNSGNKFYFAIFDCKDSGVPIGYDKMDEA